MRVIGPWGVMGGVCNVQRAVSSCTVGFNRSGLRTVLPRGEPAEPSESADGRQNSNVATRGIRVQCTGFARYGVAHRTLQPEKPR